jgi:hypothetical protein
MAVNPDPKPGRWILPLVILGMVAFTYFFVSELPEASPDTTLAGAEDTTTTTTNGSTDTTAPANGENGDQNLDPETQAYLDELDIINDELQVLGTEMVSINTGFDADPREIEYSDAVAALEALVADVEALSDRVDALTVPEALQVNHDVITTTINNASGAASDALDGLQSSDTGELRRAAAESFSTLVDDFATEVANAHDAAGGQTNA